MKVYTGIGDHGTTSILGEQKVPKNDSRIDAYGSVDELNSLVGWVSTFPIAKPHVDQLRQIQNNLFTIGSCLASTPEALIKLKLNHISLLDIKDLENWIDSQTHELPPLMAFILPGSCEENAACHMARTVCRRAERNIVEQHHASKVDQNILVYMNRLSDYLFTLSRTMTRLANSTEVEWKSK